VSGAVTTVDMRTVLSSCWSEGSRHVCVVQRARAQELVEAAEHSGMQAAGDSRLLLCAACMCPCVAQVDDSGKVSRLRKQCPQCGPGIFMATHFDRVYCGKCTTTYLVSSSTGWQVAGAALCWGVKPCVLRGCCHLVHAGGESRAWLQRQLQQQSNRLWCLPFGSDKGHGIALRRCCCCPVCCYRLCRWRSRPRAARARARSKQDALTALSERSPPHRQHK
jgi:ribosomal protein S27AE